MILRNKIKRICSLFLVLLLLCCFAPSVKVFADGETVIHVISCDDYIFVDEDTDEILTDLFNKEYEGEIRVIYDTLATPEDMYNELSRNPEGIDVVCPSEYMIMKMMSEGLIKPYNTPKNMIDYGSPYINDVFKSLKVNINGEEVPVLSEDETKTYATGYMWGTMGFVYNMNEFSVEDLKNWDSILTNADCMGKTTIKDSIRDTYIMAVGAVYKDELLSLDKTAIDYNEQLTRIFNRTDDQTVALVEEYLQKLRVNLYGFEVDSGKDDILKGNINVNFAWSGDAVYAMDCGDEANVELGYIVPEEGSNVWFDGFVMSSKCTEKEEKAVEKFLNYISDPENAIKNMEYTGYTSVIGGDIVFDWLVDYYELETEEQEDFTEVDLSYFFAGTPTGDYKVYTDTVGRQLYAQYSDYETIQRCAVMDNFSNEDLIKIGNMWSRVKLTTLSTLAIILIIALFVLVVIAVLFIKNKEAVLSWKIVERIKIKRKRKYQVVKIEKID